MEIVVTALAAAILVELAILSYIGVHYRVLLREVRRLEQERDEEDRMLRLCRERVKEQAGDQSEEHIEINALAAYNQERQQEIAHRKQVILDKLMVSNTLQTHHVADLLDVSRNTAYGYLNELVEAGKLRQVGESGPEVKYQLCVQA